MYCGPKGKSQLSRDEALKAMKRLQALGDDDAVAALNIYKCTFCGRWHVGHKKARPVAS